MTPDQRALVRDAFPEDENGDARCGLCGEPRKPKLLTCFKCWRRLSEFARAELLKSSLVDKAHFIVQMRPVKA
jgi:hypothetical protein